MQHKSAKFEEILGLYVGEVLGLYVGEVLGLYVGRDFALDVSVWSLGYASVRS